MALTDSPYNEPFPMWSTEQETPHPQRYLPLPTATTLKDTSLFGIPLKSAFTGQTMSDATLEGYIQKAISRLEHELNIFITPVAFEERQDYSRELWTQQNAWMKLNNGPILDVQEVSLSFGSGTPLPPIITFPLEYVTVHPQDPAIQLVPILGTPTAGFVLSSFAGAQFAALMAAGIYQFPNAVKIRYRAGFDKDKCPALISGLVEKMAAVMAMSALGPVFMPYNSVSIGLDGVSQGTGSAGINFFATRLQDLQTQIQQEIEAAKSYYLKRILIDYI